MRRSLERFRGLASGVVYPSAYGLRPSVIDFADKLRAAGHIVHTPDLYDGEVFTDRNDAIQKIQELGFDKMLERASEAVEKMGRELVYAGFSNGGICASCWPQRDPVRAAQS